MIRIARGVVAICMLCSLAALPAVAATDARLAHGSGSFAFPFVSAGEPRAITVWYHRPAKADADAPILFVMHGLARNAQTYRKYWIPIAEERGYALLVPEFSNAEFPGSRGYNLGNRVGADGTEFPRAQWSYSAIEAIFDAVRQANGLSARTYDIYGHSAGAQFVHRMVWHMPQARFHVAVAANAGWYTMPDFDVRFPHGLDGAGIDRQQVAQAFNRRLIVLLGDADTDPNHHSLSRTPGAMAQGLHRLERGQNFYRRAQRMATELGVPFAWKIGIGPGVAHSNARMAPFAAEALAAAAR